MKRIFTTLLAVCLCTMMWAQGWPEKYTGVMLQGFYWDSYSDTKWTTLEKQATELGQNFDLVWLPQGARATNSTSMGYDPLYWFTNYNSSFGTEAELRSLISTFKSNGIKTIADVVINHRGNLSNWVDFPAETYKGVTYQLKSTDIVANDDGGATKTWANQNGYSLSTNNDSGEDWPGMRDLDHKSANVQTNVKAYLDMLLNDLGYAGFRYDMVKGYSASFTGTYNKSSNPEFCVGEYWDGTTKIKNWIDGTDKTSAAFDFQFRYTVRNAVNKNDWSYLGKQNDGNDPLIKDNNYKRYAVTFVENHDVQDRGNVTNYTKDPIVRDTLAANAYLLAMPGTPCVFLTHWLDCKDDIKAMIAVRKAAGIHNQSNALNAASSTNYYVVMVDSKLMAVVGKGAGSYTPTNQNYVKVLSGYHYAYYLNKTLNTAWVDLASGEYENARKVTLTAVAADGAQLVYTTNGTNPIASSTKVSSGTQITIPVGTTTLKVGLLINGVVSGIITRTYKITEPVAFEPYNITVYVNAENVGWNDYVNYHSWGDKRTGTSWPGDKVTATKTINGKKWYYKTYQITSDKDLVNFVFSIGTSSNANQNQTVDVNNINQDAYFEISATRNSENKFPVSDVTSTMTGIEKITTTRHTTDDAYYTLSGQRIAQPTQRGIYIHQGKKIVIR